MACTRDGELLLDALVAAYPFECFSTNLAKEAALHDQSHKLFPVMSIVVSMIGHSSVWLIVSVPEVRPAKETVRSVFWLF